MQILLIFTFCLITAGSDAVTTVTGYRGRSVQIKCPYGSGYEDYNKYLCRGGCPYVGNRDIPVRSGSPAEDTRFSLYDDTTSKVFTVTITDLRTEDGNTYWCVIQRAGPNIYTEVLLLVETEDPAVTTVSHTTLTSSTHSASTHSMSPSVPAEITHSVTANPVSDANHRSNTHNVPGVSNYIMISAGAVLLAGGVIIAIYCKIHRHGSETETRSSTETNGDYENVPNLLPLQAKRDDLPETTYEILDPAPDQSEPIYENLASTNNQ